MFNSLNIIKTTGLIVICFLFLGVRNPYSENQMATAHFAVSITNSNQTGLITYAIVKVFKGKIVSKKFLRKADFVQMIVGRIPNPANVERKNLFIENGLDTCVVYIDDVMRSYKGCDCIPLENLWKIKYKEHPVQTGLEIGWSQEYYSPSLNQLQFLNKEYNVWSMTMYFYGDAFWKLLNDMMNPDWVRRYMSVGV